MKYNFEALQPTKRENFENINKKFQSDLEYIEISYIISTNIQDYREKYHLTQKKLADMLEVSQEMVSKLESGNSNISIKKLVEIWNRLSNKEYDFTSKLLNQIMQKTRENYNRCYYNDHYHLTLTLLQKNKKEKEIEPKKYETYKCYINA